MVKVTIQYWLLLKNNYPSMTDFRTRMTFRKHFLNFEEILFAVEADFRRTTNRLSRTSFPVTASFQRNKRGYGT